MRAIGLMSGTSLDGVDVAVVDTDGEVVQDLGPSGYRAYREDEKAILRRALATAAVLDNRHDRSGVLAEAERIVTDAHAEAIENLVGAGVDVSAVDIVGFHGQTVLHRPERGLTVQLGNGAALARRVGLPVAYDFRQADVSAHGQGAPLVPVFHRALVRKAGLPVPLAVVNIGGVANITFIGSDGTLTGFDTGPGNALIDDLVRKRTGADCDRDGMLALSGKLDPTVLARLCAAPYFDAPPPKSLDRNTFADVAGQLDALSDADAVATLTAFTANSIAGAASHLAERPDLWVVAGGGARNPAILQLLARQMVAPVRTAADVGLSIDALEAQAFGYLAVRTRLGLPLTFPGTTGVSRPLTGGVVALP